MEFTLDTVASCSIIKLWRFWENLEFLHRIRVKRTNKLTETYSDQVVPMMGYATENFSYDRNSEFSFPLAVWITEKRT